MKINCDKGALTFFVTTRKNEVFFIKENNIRPFSEIQIHDLNMLRRHFEADYDRVICLENAGIHDPVEQIRIWISCNFSTITSTPDFLDGVRVNYSRPRCSLRASNNCPYNCNVCDGGKLLAPEFSLSKRQVEVLSVISEDISEIEMANRLFISVDTLRNHKQNLRQILNTRSSVGLALFAKEFCN